MSVVIPIDDNYQIELDKHAWQVSCWVNRRSHENGGTWEGISWHRTLQEAGMACQRLLVAEDDIEGVQEVIDAVHRSAALIAMVIAKSEYEDYWLDQANA